MKSRQVAPIRPRYRQTHEPCIQFTVILQRYYLAHLLAFYIPSGLFVGISWSSVFWPAEVIPGRTVLVITSLLAVSNLYADSRQNSPKTSYVKALDAWMFFSILISVCTLFQYATVLHVLGKNPKKRENRRIGRKKNENLKGFIGKKIENLKSLFQKFLEDFIFRRDNTIGFEVPPTATSADPDPPYKLYQERVEKIWMYFVPIFFFLFNITYWLYILNMT
ncbi:Glutamate-gated chloride channel alpha [Armadillidium vulgare]|nr:Glutamate-gated chloride channel alpha [Armadillidium vulgare]